MADLDKNYTSDQRKAVIAEGRNVLVSASAGSGKTFVMIERVIRLIVEGKAEVGERDETKTRKSDYSGDKRGARRGEIP